MAADACRICGHTETEHAATGFVGWCAVNGCGCSQYRPPVVEEPAR